MTVAGSAARMVPTVERVEIVANFSRSMQAVRWEQLSSLPLQFLLLTVAGWMTRDQRRVTEYLLAENKVLRQQLRGRRIRYTDAQRRRLALAAIKLGRRALLRMDTVVTPDTLHGAALELRCIAIADGECFTCWSLIASTYSPCGSARRVRQVAAAAPRSRKPSSAYSTSCTPPVPAPQLGAVN
jgi:hypothetical protein